MVLQRDPSTSDQSTYGRGGRRNPRTVRMRTFFCDRAGYAGRPFGKRNRKPNGATGDEGMKKRFDYEGLAVASFAIVAFVGVSSSLMSGVVHLAIVLSGA